MEVVWHVVGSAVAVSLLAGLCTAVLPASRLSNRKSSTTVFLRALAIASMFGDAALHLFPQIYGASMHEHTHDHEHKHGTEGHVHGDPKVAGIMIASVLLCAVLEHGLHVHEGALNLLTDAVHNFLDGVAIAVGFSVSIEAGYATAFAAAMHELPQELSDSGILLASGFSKSSAIVWNVLCALTCVVGAMCPAYAQAVPKEYMLAAVAGSFLYISIGDLLPKVMQSRKPVPIVLGLALGLGVMVALGEYEDFLQQWFANFFFAHHHHHHDHDHDHDHHHHHHDHHAEHHHAHEL